MANRTHSGARAELFNLRERATSDDFVRLQQFADAAAANRYLRSRLASSTSATSGGKTSVPSAVGAPPAALVLEGLTPRPEIGTTSLFVAAGVLAVVFPDSDPHPDDSPCRLIEDPGVQAAGTLALTAGGVGVRVDVLECQPTTVVQESDNRDRFNPQTGTFAPVTLDKVTRGGLAYRIRLGAPGGGFPGVVSGWLPLMVARVPTTATTWDDCDCWDVRPLLSDLAHSRVEVASFGQLRRANGRATNNGAGVHAIRGLFEGELAGFRVGGELASSSSGATSLDAGAAGSIREPGFAVVNDSPWFLYLAQPFGLPRWCRLNPATTLNRDPGSLRGVPVFTQSKTPAGLNGTPSAPVALPSSTALGGSTGNALCVLAGFFAGANFEPLVAAAGLARHLSAPTLAPSAGAGTATVTYTFAPNVRLPANATEVVAQLDMTVTDAAGTVYPTGQTLTVVDADGLNVAVFRQGGTRTVPVAGSFGERWEVRFPVPASFPAGGTQTFTVFYQYTTGGVGAPAFSGQLLTVLGWRLGV